MNLGIIGLMDFKSVTVEATKITLSYFLDGNCNITTEMLLVISYTVVTVKSYIITVHITIVMHYCPTLCVCVCVFTFTHLFMLGRCMMS